MLGGIEWDLHIIIVISYCYLRIRFCTLITESIIESKFTGDRIFFILSRGANGLKKSDGSVALDTRGTCFNPVYRFIKPLLRLPRANIYFRLPFPSSIIFKVGARIRHRVGIRK